MGCTATIVCQPRGRAIRGALRPLLFFFGHAVPHAEQARRLWGLSRFSCAFRVVVWFAPHKADADRVGWMHEKFFPPFPTLAPTLAATSSLISTTTVLDRSNANK